MTDEHRIQRFIDARSATYESAIQQLRQRVLDPAWMAFVFPRFVNCYHCADETTMIQLDLRP